MRTSNPALRESFMSDVPAGEGVMTINGTMTKTFILFCLVLVGAAFTWNRVFTGGMADVTGLMMGGAILGLILAIVTIFKKEWASKTAPAYALAEGVFLGGISALFESRYPGIAMQSVGLTFGTLLTMLGAYRSGLIVVTQKFRLGIVAATGGICLFYLGSFVMQLFGMDVSFVNGSGLFSIGISLFVVGIAALNLVLDFDFIDRASQARMPKYMEWYGAFSLMVTLIWLYLEILRLMAKLNDRRR